MAVETLKIVLTADNKQAIAGMNETVNSLNKVSDAGAKTGGAVTKMGTNFTGLSRVIQDLPYGFNAISNNLTQILPAAGALGLAFSGVVAGLSFMELGFGAWTRALDKIKGPLSMTDQLNQNYVKTLAEEKVQLDNLFKVAEDNNQSLKVREQAVAKLRETTGPYLQDLTDDQIMTGLAKDAHNELTEALKKQSIAQAALALGAPIQQKILEYDIELINQKKQAVQDYINASKGGTESISTGPGGPSVRITAEQRQLGVRNQFERDRAALLKKQAEEQAKLNQLQDIAAKNAGIDLKNPPPPKEKINGGLENYMNNLREVLPLLERFNAEYSKQNFGQKGGITGEMIAPQRNTGTQDLQNLQLQVSANNTLNNALAERNSKQMEYETQLRESQAAALTNTLMNSVNGLFTAMQNGASVGDAIGNMFKQIAIDIAKAAIQAAIFQAILMALPGGSSVGFAKGATGIFKSLLGFSEGGTVSGPQSGYPVMLHGTEHIVRPDQMKSIIASASQMGGSGASRVVVEGRIQGQDIWLSQQRTNTFRGLTT
jgi:hypothetical protein